MNNNIFNDNELRNLFEQDAKNINPDDAVRKRLEYAFMVKNRSYKTVQNSFAGMFTWLFSWSQLPLKGVIVALLFMFSFSIFNMKTENSPLLPSSQDSTLNVFPLNIDSSVTSPYYADTCAVSKASIKNEGKINNTFPSLINMADANKSSFLPVNYKIGLIAASIHFLSLNHPILRQFQEAGLNNKGWSESHSLA